MELCSNGHDEVCFESRKCPACEINDELKDTRMEVTALQQVIGRLEGEIEELVANGEG
jgi:hypothetical protein